MFVAGEEKMRSRREFMKEAATAGVLVLGAKSGLGVTKEADARGASKSKVVIARDSSLHGSDGKLDAARVSALLDRAVLTYTGQRKPVEAWKKIVLDGGAK